MCRFLTSLHQTNHSKFPAFVVLLLLFPLNVFSQSRIPKPPQTQSWEVKGQALIQAGRFDDAIKHFNQVKQANPKDARPYFYLGMALMEIGEISQATSELDEAVRLDPIKPEYALFKASAQTRLGQKELALKALLPFKRREPSKQADVGLDLAPGGYLLSVSSAGRCVESSRHPGETNTARQQDRLESRPGLSAEG